MIGPGYHEHGKSILVVVVPNRTLQRLLLALAQRKEGLYNEAGRNAR